MAIRKKKDDTTAAGGQVNKSSAAKRAASAVKETIAKATKAVPAMSPQKSAPAKVSAPVKSSSKKTASSPPKKATTPPAKTRSQKEAIEELQHVGADVVPSVTLTVDTEAATLGNVSGVAGSADTKLSEGGPILDHPGANAGAATSSGAATEAAPTQRGEDNSPLSEGGPIMQDAAAGAPEDRTAGETPIALSEAGPIISSAGAVGTVVDNPLERSGLFEQTNDTTANDTTATSPSAELRGTPRSSEEPAAQAAPTATRPESMLSDWDLHLFNEGTHLKLWEKLGSHIVPGGVMFAVWAPNAASVSVVGDFNGWKVDANPLHLRGASGIWEGFVPDLGRGATYKYHIVSQHNGYRVSKADPFAVHHETPPATASKVWDLEYEWQDDEWMRARRQRNSFEAPMSIYEVHLGSWRRTTDDGGHTWRSMSYREIAKPLAEYVQRMNFTHIELMPLQEHPFYGSWGYQGTGYFAPTSRYGTPQDLKYLIDVLHQHNIGVIIDWVPSHFPSDEHGLGYFDGTHLFEHADPRKGFQPDWGSLIFNYGRNEVRAFLASSALYWLDEYHADGLRVDAVASMLYLDYSRKQGEWIPNEFGGRENIEAIAFLRRVNEDIYKVHPDVQVIAEESTAWPMVSRPTYVGGLGFGMKWDMGWMHDTLRYFSREPVHRKFHHNDLTFRMMYAFTENFVLPLSHDEVVHGKGSLIGKMPGDPWRKFANLRLLFSHMYANPGKKLIFMGGEIAQYKEWNHDASLEWDLLYDPMHAGLNRFVEDLNKLYRDVPALHELDMSPDGFEWIDCCDTDNSVVTLMRKSRSRPGEDVVVVLNFTPTPRHNYQIGVPRGGHWREVLNSDAPLYGGSGQGNMGGVDAAPIPLHGRRWSTTVTLPPLGAIFLMSQGTGSDVATDASESRDQEELS